MADPRRARRLRWAARRAVDSGTDSITSQVFRNRLALASRPACPCKHSIKTADGTTGGHRPSCRNARMRARDDCERLAKRLTPPESKTSTVSWPAVETGAQQSAAPLLLHARALWRRACQPALTILLCTCDSLPRDLVVALLRELLLATTPMPATCEPLQPGTDRRASRLASAAYV